MYVWPQNQCLWHFCYHSRMRTEWQKAWVTMRRLSLEIKHGHPLSSCLMSHTINMCPLHGLCRATFSAFLCFLLLVSLLKMAVGTALRCCPVLLRARRLWCALWRKSSVRSASLKVAHRAVGHELSGNGSVRLPCRKRKTQLANLSEAAQASAKVTSSVWWSCGRFWEMTVDHGWHGHEAEGQGSSRHVTQGPGNGEPFSAGVLL